MNDHQHALRASLREGWVCETCGKPFFSLAAAGGAGVAHQPAPADGTLIALDLYTIAERLEEGDSIGDLPLGWSGTFARLRQAADAVMAAAALPDAAGGGSGETDQ